jgi:hypothetical protein
VPATCTAETFCRDYTLALGPQPLDAFTATATASVSGQDKAGNTGAGQAASLLTVTRWKWARRVTPGVGSSDIVASPAIGAGGKVYVAVNLSQASGGGVYEVTPQGAVSSVASSGAIAASPAIGRTDTGVDVLYYLDQSNGLRALGASSCGTGDTANLGSIAVLNDGMATVKGAGVVQYMGAPALRAVDSGGCAVVGANAVPGIAFPGNLITDGSGVWYPAANGSIQWTTTALASPASLTGFGAGTIFGMALFGSKFAGGGGGGGSGIGRIFVANTDGGTITGDNPGRHVSGVAVGHVGNDVLFAVTEEETSNTGLLKRFDSAGGNPTPVSWGAFAFDFPNTATPGGTTPVLGANGWVYVVANNGNVAAVGQSAMDVRWTKVLTGLTTPGTVLASATLDCNRDKPTSATGVYYFATTTGWLVAYVVDSPGLDTTAPWPKYQHDARNTGNLSVSKACP